MTREVAIKAIQDFIGWFKEDSLIRKALEMAIQALSQEPTEKPMTVDEMEREYEKSKALFRKIVECDELPPVTPKTGKWIYKVITDDYRVTGQCSECKERRIIDNYCPNCGAKMESEDKE